MFVPFADAGVDARDIDPDVDRGFLGMLAVHHDRAVEFREVAFRRSEKVPDFERDRRIRPIDLECFAAMGFSQYGDGNQEKQAAFHDGEPKSAGRVSKIALVTPLLLHSGAGAPPY